MPVNRLNEFINRLKSLENKMEQHLTESVEVHQNISSLQADIAWVKWFVIAIAGGIGTIVVGLTVYALKG